MHAKQQKKSHCQYSRRGAARENNRHTHPRSRRVVTLFLDDIVIIWLPLLHTKTKVHSRTESTVKFEEKQPFLDWWRVVVGVDSKTIVEHVSCFWCTHTIANWELMRLFHTHTQQSKNV